MKQRLCFGDSNTYGLVPGENARYEWGVRWTSLLEEGIREKGYRVVEEGLCGRTTIFKDAYRIGRKGTDVLPVLLETHNPIEAVVLMLGTNDCKAAYGASAADIGAGMEQLLDQIGKRVSPDKILLISPIALGERVWQPGFDEEFNENSVAVSKELPNVYQKIAQRRGLHFLKASDYAKPSLVDQEHLNEKGHRRLGEAVLREMEEILEIRRSVAC